MKILLLSIILSFSFNSLAAKKTYDSLSACEKQDVLWSKVTASQYRRLPALTSVGFKQIAGLFLQYISKKVSYNTDFAPDGWKKYLHLRGSVAKVKFVPNKNNPYTGLWQGASCGILRMSITGRPKAKGLIMPERGFAPGLALKLLRDKEGHSANVSALYTLSGQGFDYNIFKNALSNIVPQGSSRGEVTVHEIFKKVTPYPETLLVEDFSAIDEKGNAVKNARSPLQIFFVPTDEVNKKFSANRHDFRDDLKTIKANTTVYKVYALSGKKYESFGSLYKISDIPSHLSEAKKQHLGDIVTTSPFIASKFGDTGIFFKHQAIRWKGN